MHTGFAIALAWPETFCKQAGSWYDDLLHQAGYGNNHYYKVGHAGLILVDGKTGACNYFDFGRYHAPYQHGRVRDKETDRELSLYSKAGISHSGEIKNLEEIVTEVHSKEACHGKGLLYASYCPINFQKAFDKAKKMQETSPMKYGPFIWRGTNCSRFVRTIVLSGNPPLLYWLKIFFPFTISPTPIGNVNSLSNKSLVRVHAFDLPVNIQPV